MMRNPVCLMTVNPRVAAAMTEHSALGGVPVGATA